MFQFFLDGKPAGAVSFINGFPVITPESWGVIDRLPVSVFPFLSPRQFRTVLSTLPPLIPIPGLGTLHVQDLT